MVRVKRRKLKPLTYPMLTPRQYLDLAERNGLIRARAIALSGFHRSFFQSWASPTQPSPRRKVDSSRLERLHRIAVDYRFEAIAFDKLSPWAYIHAAGRNDYIAVEAQALSGFGIPAWSTWLYEGREMPDWKKERLSRVAIDMGWEEDSS